MTKIALCALIASLAGLQGIACSGESPTVAERILAPAMGNGGGGGPPKVDATDPTGADQGTRLDVRVLGSNFAPGSVVTFLLDRKTVADVVTNSTTFVSETELVADVSIGAEAPPDLYDVEVLSRGKKGIGVEKFEVRQVTFTMTVSGDLSAGDPDAWRSPAGGLDQIVGGFPALDVQAWVLNSANLQQCFPDPTIKSGAFSITRKSGGEVTVGFNPVGNGTDGTTTGIRYLVLMDGQVTDPPFPPTLGDDATVTLLNWQIDHDTGKGKKVACSESGTFSQPTTIAISQNPPAP